MVTKIVTGIDDGCGDDFSGDCLVCFEKSLYLRMMKLNRVSIKREKDHKI